MAAGRAESAKTWLTSGVGQMCSVERSRNGLFISSIGASLLCAPINAAAIASVHVGVIAWQQSRTTEQRTIVDLSDSAWERLPRS